MPVRTSRLQFDGTRIIAFLPRHAGIQGRGLIRAGETTSWVIY